MYVFVTTFNEEGYHKYGKNMLESVADKWNPKHFSLVAYYEGFDIEATNPPTSEAISYRNLNDIKELLEFKEENAEHNGTEGGNIKYDWRFDAVRFSHKVYALSELAFEMMEDTFDESNWIIWLDADTVTTKRLDVEKVREWLPDQADIVHLGRKDFTNSETGFVGYNLSNIEVCKFIADFRGLYTSTEFLGYREWHDGYLFERLLNRYKAHGLVTNNLSEYAEGLAVFEQSPLAEYFTHFKGNLKNGILQVSPDGVDYNVYKRYGQLIKLVQHYEPKTILEVGTYNGSRAIQMAIAAFTNLDKVTYYGFDLFEDATPEINTKEKNVKPSNNMDLVSKRLNDFRKKMKEKGKTFNFRLFKGDSKETLATFKGVNKVDFAFIDGGHSTETIKSDYENLKHVPCIVFDDYYSKDSEGNIPDERGINEIVDGIKDAKTKIIFPSQDLLINNEGVIHIALVITKEGIKLPPEDMLKTPIVVTPRDSRPSKEIIDNIKKNQELIEDYSFVGNRRIHNETAFIISAGPSVDYDLLKQRLSETGGKVFCVKHSYPLLLENGISPFCCVILDPRPITGTSTHGIVRKDLFKTIDPDTLFLVASMTDPSVTKHLLKNKANVRGWHALSNAVRDTTVKEGFKVNEELNIEEGSTLVTGGTCSAMRAISMAHILGFRNFELFGFDCTIPEETMTEDMKKELLPAPHDDPDMKEKRPKYFQVEHNDKGFWTTGELLAMAQDCERLFDETVPEMGIVVHGEGTLVKSLWDSSKRNQESHYTEFLNV